MQASLRATLFCLGLMLAGCSSTPSQYFTLISAPSEAPALSAAMQFELQPVRIPVQVDQPGLVIRQSDGRLAVLESALWASPLADEVHDALSVELEHQLGTRDLSGLPKDRRRPLVSILVDVRRFDALAGDRVVLDALWHLRRAQGGELRKATCSGVFQERAGADLESMVLAYQRAIGRLAKSIAAQALSGDAATAGCSYSRVPDAPVAAGLGGS